MIEPRDIQLEHELTHLGSALVQRAPEGMPPALAEAVARRRRSILTRRVAIAAALVLTAAGAYVVFQAAHTWAPVPAPQRIARPNTPTAESAPAPMEHPPSSIASLKQAWERTGEADPPVVTRGTDWPYRPGDVADRTMIDSLNSSNK